MYTVTSPGNCTLPDELTHATDQDVEDVVRRAAAHLGWKDAVVARVASVIGGSCMACIDVVASVDGTAVIVARPELY